MKQQWIEIGHLNDIPKLGSRVVETDSGNIAIFRTSNDQVFALKDRCPHKGGQLSQGIVSGILVACPLHNWKIDLKTGEATAPDKGCTRRYEIKCENGQLWLAL
ncbi:MAG: Assimilatory nitrite reductase small subunit [Pseudomonadota bacterium]|jgi:nitrite reductase (NADH) small subunit